MRRKPWFMFLFVTAAADLFDFFTGCPKGTAADTAGEEELFSFNTAGPTGTAIEGDIV